MPDEARIQEIERRLAPLEARLDPDVAGNPPPADWRGGIDLPDEAVALFGLWDETHDETGRRRVNKRYHAEGMPVPDLQHGFLQPRTWAQVVDCLVGIADHLDYEADRREEVAESTRTLHSLIENLTREAGASTSDAAERFALLAISNAHATDNPDTAKKLETCWLALKAYAEGNRSKAFTS